jgi:hypothetical protein
MPLLSIYTRAALPLGQKLREYGKFPSAASRPWLDTRYSYTCHQKKDPYAVTAPACVTAESTPARLSLWDTGTGRRDSTEPFCRACSRCSLFISSDVRPSLKVASESIGSGRVPGVNPQPSESIMCWRSVCMQRL